MREENVHGIARLVRNAQRAGGRDVLARVPQRHGGGQSEGVQREYRNRDDRGG